MQETLFLKIQTSDSERKLKKLEGNMKLFEKAAKKAQGTLPKTNRDIEKLGKKAKKSAADVDTLKKSLIGFAKGIAVGAAITAWFKGFAEADRASGAVKTLGVNVDELKGRLLDVSRASGNLKSQTELLTASYDIASAGFANANEISAILAASIDGAVGGMSTLAKVSDAATSVMNSYGLSAEHARGLIDGFIQTQNDGKIVVDQYASQIGRIAPIAFAAGISIEELNAAIATVTASGLQVEQTFTGMSQAIQSIMKPTTDAQRLAKEFGFEFNATALNAKGLSGVLLDMKTALGGNKEAMNLMFGSVEATKAVLPLLNDDLVTFNKNLENQKDSAGAAAAASLIMSGTVGQALKRIMNGLGNVVRNLDFLGVAFKGLLSVVDGFIQGFLGLPKWFQIAATSAVALSLAVVAVVPLIGGLVGVFGLLKGAAVVAAGGLGVALAPILLIAAKIGAAVAGVTALWAAFNKFRDLRNMDKEGFAAGLIKEGDAGKVSEELSKVEREIAKHQKRIDNMKEGKFNLFRADPEKLEKLKALQKELLEGLEQINKASTEADSKTDGNPEGDPELNKRVTEFLKNKVNLKTAEQKAGELLMEQLEAENKMLQAKIDGTEAVEKLERQIAEAKLKAAGFSKEEIQNILDTNEALTKKLTLQEKAAELYKSIGDDIKSGLVDGIKAAITGAKSLGEVLSNMLSRIGDKLLNLGIDSLLSGLGGGGGGGIFGKLFPKSAEGRYASSPMVSSLAEKGEPEYVIPSGRMAEATSRYQSGLRGESVIPKGTGGGSGGASGGTTQVNYSGPILNFNSEEFVPKSAISQIINSAASKGARAGEARTMSSLRNSRSARTRVGI